MEFCATGMPLSGAGPSQAASILDIDQAALWAVLTVETLGFGFLADRRPRTLFERHIFHRRTNGRYSDTHAGISHPQPGGYLGDAAEYDRLQQGLALDRESALLSTSWGIAQIMGFNFALAGFASVEAMVNDMIADEDRQLAAMVNFVHNSQLSDALRRQDWQAFARGFNGPNYTQRRYDEQLAAAYARTCDLPPDLTLRAAQAALLYLDFNPGPVDGLPGRRTHSALSAFQSCHGLAITGELNPVTHEVLMNAAFPPGHDRARPIGAE
jgi:hypothetical protein